MKEKIKDVGKKRIIAYVAIMICCIVAIWVFFRLKKPTRLNDLAYDVNKQHGYTVYVEEKSGYVPYLVLTNNYEGNRNVLLVRKHILEEHQPYNVDYNTNAYYEESYIDQYLNAGYLLTLSPGVQECMVNSRIRIQNSSVWSGGGPRGEPDITYIDRKVFLLSFMEVAPASIGSFPKDGKGLRYFKDNINRFIAQDASGELTSWTLRSGLAEDIMSNIIITYDKRVSSCSIFDSMGIRPAFCLSRDMEIVEDNTIKEGLNVFVLKVPE